jgi:hypothetical protein
MEILQRFAIYSPITVAHLSDISCCFRKSVDSVVHKTTQHVARVGMEIAAAISTELAPLTVGCGKVASLVPRNALSLFFGRPTSLTGVKPNRLRAFTISCLSDVADGDFRSFNTGKAVDRACPFIIINITTDL